MEGMGVFFFLILLWIFSAAMRGGARKGAGKSKQTIKVNGKAGRNSDAQAPSLGTAMEARMQQEFPHLYSQEGESMEGVDPCHDDPEEMPVGSLGGESMEGKDPCHDDPYAMPSGSLEGISMEGLDPCHDEWEPLGAETAGEEATTEKPGGLKLDWTGDELVKGFVYGEILRRR
ncbi:MAG: hypothetical protein IJ188_07575 [Clostridia bacterium]|nr:hypothetical protein [Clostridia bacterium]